MFSKPSVRELILGFKQRKSATLAQAITYSESQLGSDQKLIREFLRQCPRDQRQSSFRIGISGTPGVGKSTYIESIGKHLIENLGQEIAVLAVDPSSEKTGGSLLGDKTRMPYLSASPYAFTRPSPSRGHLGGVAAKTKEALELCELFGFDFLLIETLGVGQAEFEVAHMTDFFLLLAQPGAGDDLQALKKGILEYTDALLINKSDELKKQAIQTLNFLKDVLGGMKGKDFILELVSALSEENIAGSFARIQLQLEQKKENGELMQKRKLQEIYWYQKTLGEALFKAVLGMKGMNELHRKNIELVRSGKQSSSDAVSSMLVRLKQEIQDG